MDALELFRDVVEAYEGPRGDWAIAVGQTVRGVEAAEDDPCQGRLGAAVCFLDLFEGDVCLLDAAYHGSGLAAAPERNIGPVVVGHGNVHGEKVVFPPCSFRKGQCRLYRDGNLGLHVESDIGPRRHSVLVSLGWAGALDAPELAGGLSEDDAPGLPKI